jgi:selenocysteine-specific elongation factor
VSATLVIGTAGHVDHGKTSLARLLTGVELDTLPEEQERGITIALGFTALELPDGRRAALIDVPGHERLVRAMIAGATGFDAVILVVSAVDGVMPQTREHLAILGLLGVRHGVVALTMADLVDEELLELAEADVADAVAGTFLQGAPVIPTSSTDGRGRDALLAAITAIDAPARSAQGTFRLPIDRGFSRTGFGTVVTGTSWSGSLRDGDPVWIWPAGTPARVRGMQVHGEPAAAAGPGLRVALNLAGVDLEQAPRGAVVASGDIPCPHVLDVLYTHLPDAGPLDDGVSVRVLLGTAESIGRLYAAADQDVFEPGRTVPAQLRLDGPLPCLPGDRLVVRLVSPVRTLGGGSVVDPWATRMRRRDRVAWGEQITRLASGDRRVWLQRAGDVGLAPSEWADRGGTDGVRLGDRVFDEQVVERLEQALIDALAGFHVEHPLLRGARRRELRRERLAHLGERVFDALLERLAGRIELDGPLVRVAGFQVVLGADEQALSASLVRTLAEVGLEGIKPKDLHIRHAEPSVTALIELLEHGGHARQIPELGWVGQPALDGLVAAVTGWFAAHAQLGPAEMKDLTGLTRRAAIPLLEWMDAQKFTAFGAEGRRTAGPRLSSTTAPG